MCEIRVWFETMITTGPAPTLFGETVTLYRAGKRVAKARLGRTCVVRFHPRVNRRTSFRAKVGADTTYRAAGSKPVRVDVLAG